MLELLQTVFEALGEEQVFNLIAMGAAAVWAWGQRQMGIDRKTSKNWNAALSFLEAGVAKTYQVYVKQRKTAAADGKLTEEEKREARELALNYARSYARDNGIELVKTIGADLVPVFLEKAVGTLKRDASGAMGISTSTGNGKVATTPTTGVASGSTGTAG